MQQQRFDGQVRTAGGSACEWPPTASANLWATRSTIQYMRPQQKWICRSSCMPEATDHQTLSAIRPPGGYQPRSEEHTSELQSRGHLVCRLLLAKKNYNTK